MYSSLRSILVLFLSLALLSFSPKVNDNANSLETRMRTAGLVDVQSLDPKIAVDLRYSTANNFVGRVLYADLRRAYLHPNLAKAVVKAQGLLDKERAGYRIVILDAARPMSVQRVMYDMVKHTEYKHYVAPATNGGRHNYGVAVDLSILDEKGRELDMGTPFDSFQSASHVGNEAELLRTGRITQQAYDNRQLLYRIMRGAGLRAYDREWWHWQERISMSQVRKRYKRLDF